MSPHLELISRSLDKLDDKRYVDFDTSSVPILILSKQESESYLLQEFGSGLISANEYREGTGREKVESELSDGLLANPSLTPIGNTEKPMETGQPEPGAAGAVPGEAPAGAPAQDQAGLPIEVTQNNIPVMDSTQNPEIFGDQAGAELADVSAGAPKAIIPSESKTGEVKSENLEEWEPVVESVVDDFFTRQRRVVMEKARSKKVKRAVAEGKATAEMLFDESVWDKQLDDDLRPIVDQIVRSASISVKSEALDDEDVDELVDDQIKRSLRVNDTTKGEIATAVLVANTLKDATGKSLGIDAKTKFLILALGAIYVVKERKKKIAEQETLSAYNSGMYLSGIKAGASNWTWVTMGDDRVRSAHRILSGKTVPMGKGFAIDGKTLRFPGDPLAPGELTIGCRCRLKFS